MRCLRNNLWHYVKNNMEMFWPVSIGCTLHSIGWRVGMAGKTSCAACNVATTICPCPYKWRLTVWLISVMAFNPSGDLWTFDLGTDCNVTRGMDNLSVSFDASATFLYWVMGKTHIKLTNDVMTFDLWGHREYCWCKESLCEKIVHVHVQWKSPLEATGLKVKTGKQRQWL